MTKYGISLIVLLTISFAACTGPTRYHPLSDGLGHSEKPLETNRYEVRYTANSLTSRRKMRQFLLYRAAELTLEKNYHRFAIVAHDPGLDSVPLYAEETSTGYRHHNFQHHHLWFEDKVVSGEEFSSSVLTFTPVSRYTASITILMFTEVDKLPADDKLFKAREVIELLGPAVVRP